MPSVLSYVFVAIIGLLTLVGGFPGAAQAYPLHPPLLATGSLFSFSGDRPTRLGIVDGQLTECPSSPNCVSTQSKDLKHLIEPLPYTGTPAAAIARLQTIITALPRTTIIEATDQYLYAEFTSALMGFVDDVEFYVDPAQQVIQVRSASRLGESDLGVNRKRVETIRQKFNAAIPVG